MDIVKFAMLALLDRMFTRFLITTLGVGIFLLIGIVAYLDRHLPPVELLKDVQLQVPLKIYSADGLLIGEYGEKRRTPINIAAVPDNLINAVIATEDRRFFQHPGVDLRGLLRAIAVLLTTGAKYQGGSTVTMQVARNFFLTRKKTYIRKINEILLALKIEQELTKEEILELYLNKIYFGKSAYGVAAAAEVYYGTSIDKLTLAQMAMIAGLPQAPSAINPLNSSSQALKRRNHVLERMLAAKYIDQTAFAQATNTPLTAKYHGRQIEIEAPYIAEMVRQYLVENVGEKIYDQGYEVITTVNSKLQKIANKAIRNNLHKYDQRHGYRGPLGKFAANAVLEEWLLKLQTIPKVHDLLPVVVTKIDNNKAQGVLQDGKHINLLWRGALWAAKRHQTSIGDVLTVGDVVYVQRRGKLWHLAQVPEVEGAIVAMVPQTGAVLALVGGFDYQHSPFNRAVQAERQPGSSFKPFIYGAALENGFTTASLINDAPIVQEDPIGEFDWRPQNYTRKFYGPTRLRMGIAKSRNLVSIRLLKAMGIDAAIKFIENCGISHDSLPHGLSLALGTNHLTPLELATAYSIFPNGGYRIKPYFISKVLDYNGEIVKNYEVDYATEVAVEDNRAMRKETAYLITSLLQDVIRLGTSRKALQLGRRDLAGKTGTTNSHMDNWYSGYNRDLVVTTWIGFDEPRTLKEYAATTALPMWMDFMEGALAGVAETHIPQPAGLVAVRIDPKTGLLARAGQKGAIYEIFTEETVPTQIAPEDPQDVDNYTDELFGFESLF